MDNRNSIERLKSIQLSLSELSNSLEETYFKMRQECKNEIIKDIKTHDTKKNEMYNLYEQLSNSEQNSTYIDKMLDAIINNQKFLASAMDEINKNCYVPIWKDVDKELPECEGIYYGKKDDTNSMWKVIFRNNEWYLSGYPEHKIDVIKWTELY